jgi:hypothetical protein
MLEPSDNFTADEIRFLQQEAEEWITKANALILAAANEGQAQARIPFYENGSKEHNGFFNAPFALQAHFKQRGFEIISNGMSSMTISWATKIEEEVFK